MIDKNGSEIKTGQVVRVTGAYFKNDNGLFLVTAVPGDPTWCGSDIALLKVGKSGKISTAKYRVSGWPLKTYTNDPWKRAEAGDWNREHAEIEVVTDVPMEYIREHFREEAANASEQAEYYGWNFGEQSSSYKTAVLRRDFLKAVAEGV